MIEFMVQVGDQKVLLTAEQARELFKELYDLFYKPTVTLNRPEQSVGALFRSNKYDL